MPGGADIAVNRSLDEHGNLTDVRGVDPGHGPGHLHRGRGQFTRAVPLLCEARDTVQELFGEDHPETAANGRL